MNDVPKGDCVYEFIPGSVASLLYLRPSWLTGNSIPCVYMSKETGVLVGRRDTPLSQCGWPMEVVAQINKYFGTVFSLPHEEWKGKSPSPRAQFVDAATPWTITAQSTQ